MNDDTPDVEFLGALDRHLAAMAERNIDAFTPTVGARVRLAGTSGTVIDGYDAAVAAYGEWFAAGEWRLDASDRVFARSDGNVGWALVRVRVERDVGTEHFNLFLLFERENDGVWRLQYDQGTTIVSS
jgi:hypothetical protein